MRIPFYTAWKKRRAWEKRYNDAYSKWVAALDKLTHAKINNLDTTVEHKELREAGDVLYELCRSRL